jgi:addiction module HigA family antidote
MLAGMVVQVEAPDRGTRESLVTRLAAERGIALEPAAARAVPYPNPGELLLEEFLQPLWISQHRWAKEIGVPAQRIGEIVAGRRAITADTDLRLCRFFGLSNGYWLRAQAAHDTEVAAKAIAAELKRIKPWPGSAA